MEQEGSSSQLIRVSSSSPAQQEQVEWDGVNKLLQHHGFKPVCFADPTENKNLSDLVLLDKKSAGEIRMTLRTMLTDSERRQTLIQELIKSNNQLKEEAGEHVSRAAQQSERATELEGLLDVVKSRVQDLEDRCLGKAVQQHNHTQQLQQEKQEALKRCEALEQTLSLQREEAAQCRRKLYFTIKEEERRLARQNQTFQHICNQVGRQSSAAEQQVLAVIDFYETRMTQLLEELRSVSGRPQASSMAQVKEAPSGVTPSFRTILKAFQEQRRESKSHIEELKREVERLKQELESRPTVRVKSCKHKVHRLEGFSKHHSMRWPAEGDTSESISERAAVCADYRHLLDEISTAVTGSSAPLGLHRQKPSCEGSQRAHFHSLLPTLEVWAQQLHLLKDLQQGLHKLAARLMPWQPCDGGQGAADAVKVEDMMLLVDSMLENTWTDDGKVLRSPTPHTLGSMVSHFQRLFDVSSLSGVYPRMNEVYTRLGEMTNTMRNLRDVLQLDSRAPAAQLVNHVARLVSFTEGTSGLQTLLGDADIDSVIVKVRQHEEFFPAFHGLITDILHTLGVSRLDDILPALTSLKEEAS